MKKWQIVKAILYISVAVLIFIFYDALMPYVGILVGGIVFLYATEELIFLSVKRKLFGSAYYLFDGIAQLLIGVILFLVSNDIIKVCLVWGVWAILRESKEMAEAIDKIPRNKLYVVNVIESVVVISLSFLMILEPNENHARLHVLLLAAELVIVVLFFALESLLFKQETDKNGEPSDKETYTKK